MTTRALPWANIRPLVREIDEIIAEEPGIRSQSDQLGAQIRDLLDDAHVEVTCERDVYVVVTTGLLFQRMLLNACAKGHIPLSVVVEHRRVFHALLAALLPYIPQEAR